jgi:hypothetical protein
MRVVEVVALVRRVVEVKVEPPEDIARRYLIVTLWYNSEVEVLYYAIRRIIIAYQQK